MKNYRKIFSIILTICMVMQMLPVFAAEATEVAAPVGLTYLINDNFGADDLNGWEAKVFEGKSSTNTAVTEPVEVGSSNYMLTYTADSTWANGYLSKAITPAVFSADKDVVIETRMKQTGTGRSFIKYNLDGRSYSENEWNYLWGTLVMNQTGNVSLVNGWKADATTGFYQYPSGFGGTAAVGGNQNVITDAKDKWYTYKIVIHGTESGDNNTADYIITDDNGTELVKKENFSIDFPNNSSWASSSNKNVVSEQNVNWVENALNSVDFRLRQAETLNIDYVQVYEKYYVDMKADASYKPGEPVKVTFDISAGNEAFKDAVALYDAKGAVVATTNTIDETNKIVTLTPDKDLTEGETYTVKCITASLPENYVVSGTQHDFIASERNYVIYDTFDDGSMGNWKIGNTTFTNYTYGVEDGAMFLALGEKRDSYDTPNLRNDFEELPYEGAENIILKMKVKQTGTTGNFRTYLKYNRPNLTTFTGSEHGSNWYTLNMLRGDYYSSRMNGDKSQADPIYTAASGTNLANKWFDVTIEFDGANNKIYTTVNKVTDENGNEITDGTNDGTTTGTLDEYAEGLSDAGYPDGFTGLHNLTWLFRSSGGANTAYIDYIELSAEYSAEMSTGVVYAADSDITVTFDKANEKFVNAVAIYDAKGNKVPAVNTIDETNKIVTINPDASLETDATYTVKFDDSDFNVNYTVANKSFTVSDTSYIIYDTFGEDDLNGWEAKVFAGKSSTNTAKTEPVEAGSSNYMLTYTTADATNSYYGYLSKAVTPVTFSTDKDVVIEARMKQTGTGRSFLKYNLRGTSYYENEWQHNWGTLVQNDTGKVSVINGWKPNAGIYSYPVNFTGSGTNMNIITTTANEWYTYKVILSGGETKDDVTADYIIYDKDGKELARREGFDIDFPDNSNWANVIAAGATNANWVEGVLNSVDFRLRNAETINIDYVKVYEMGIAQATLANGRYNKSDEPIVLNVTTEYDGAVIPETSVVLKNGNTVIETTAKYDAEAGTFTVTPAAALTIGTVYTLTLTDSDSIHFTGTTSFEIEGRGDYETTAVDDNFDNGTDGWAAGASNITTTVEQDTTTFAAEGKKVLKIVSTDSTAKNADGYQPVAYKKLGNGFKITEGKDIVIKTSIYQTAENMGRFDLKFNRPNSATQVSSLNDFNWMSYNLLRQASNKASLPNTFGADNFNYGVDFTGLDPVGKWVEYTLTIDGTNKKITATAVADNKTYTAIGVFDLPTDAFEAEYGVGGAPAYVQAITSLTFKNTTANNPVYVDYIKVYDNLVMVSADIDGEIVELGEATEVYATGYDKGDFSEYVKLYSGGTAVNATKSYNEETGTVSIKPETAPVVETTYKLVLDLPAGYDYTGSNEFTVTHKPAGTAISESFDGNLDNWSKTNDKISGEIKTEGTNNYLQVSASEILSSEAGTKSFTYSMPLDFMMDADGYTVLEAKIRATGTDYRKMLRLNADFTALETAKTTNTPWQINYASGKFSSTYYCYDSDVENGAPDAMGDYTEGKWYTVRTIYDNVNRTVSFILLDENGNLISRRIACSMTGMYGTDETNPAAWWFNYKDIARTDREKMRYIDNIALSLRSNVASALAEAETFDIDDIKLYNTEDVEDLLGYFEVSIIDADGNDITGEGNLPKEGGTFKTKVNYSFGTSKSFSVITALYNGDKLETVKVKDYTDVTSAIEDVNEIKVSSGIDRTIKVFVWSSLDDAMPIMAPAISSSSESVKVYVSTYGNDENDGSKDAPVASLTAAQEIAKTYNEDVTVLIEDGEYLISEPVNLDYNGKKNSSIAYKATGDSAEIIAGVVLEVNDADKVEEEAILGRLVDESAKEHLYVLDLSSYDIPDAALPGVYSHTYLNSAEAPNLVTGQWVTEPKTTCEVFLEDEALTVARYPNKDDEKSGYKGYMTVEKIVNAGATPREWMSDKNTVAYADRDITDVFKIGYTDTDTDGSRMDKWAAAVSLPEKDRPIMYGFWRWDWAVQSVPIAAIDTENNVITSKYPSTYGMLTKTGSDEPASNRRFYVFNLLEEIDERGEYFIDRTNKKLYFYKTDDMNGKRLMVSLNNIENALNITGDYTTIDGLKVNTCQGAGIRVAGNNITLVNCEISNTADFGAAISGYNCTLKDSHIFNVDGGVYVSGGESATFKAANHLIENNEFENFSRISKLSVPAVQMEGVGIVVSHNEIHNAEHSAIMYGGLNHQIIYNNIYDVCKESDDAGVIYAGRSWVNRGNEIKYNYIHDIASTITGNGGASPIAGIFFDDHLAGGYVEGNIFANIAGDGIRGNAGREHTITNNIFVNCSLRGTRISAPSTVESNFVTQINGVKQYIGNEAWETKYPILFTEENGVTVVNTAELMKGNGNTYTKNFAAGCGTPFLFDVNVAESNNSNVSTDVFGGNYSDIAGKVTGIDGFAQIPFEKIRKITD